MIAEDRSGNEEDRSNFEKESGGKLAAEEIINEGDDIPEDEHGSGKEREVEKPFPDFELPLFWMRCFVFPEKKHDSGIDRENHHQGRDRPADGIPRTLVHIGQRVRKGKVGELEQKRAKGNGRSVERNDGEKLQENVAGAYLC